MKTTLCLRNDKINKAINVVSEVNKSNCPFECIKMMFKRTCTLLSFGKNKNMCIKIQRLLIPQQRKHLFTLSYTRDFGAPPLLSRSMGWMRGDNPKKNLCLLGRIWRLTLTKGINRDGFLKHSAR